jgi:hypothetical protein
MTAATAAAAAKHVLSTAWFPSSKKEERKETFPDGCCKRNCRTRNKMTVIQPSEWNQSHQECSYYKWISMSSENNGGKFRKERKKPYGYAHCPREKGKKTNQIRHSSQEYVRKDDTSKKFLCNCYVY